MTPPRWFRGCLTAWAMRYVRWLWQLGEWKQEAGGASNGS